MTCNILDYNDEHLEFLLSGIMLLDFKLHHKATIIKAV